MIPIDLDDGVKVNHAEFQDVSESIKQQIKPEAGTSIGWQRLSAKIADSSQEERCE